MLIPDICANFLCCNTKRRYPYLVYRNKTGLSWWWRPKASWWTQSHQACMDWIRITDKLIIRLRLYTQRISFIRIWWSRKQSSFHRNCTCCSYDNRSSTWDNKRLYCYCPLYIRQWCIGNQDFFMHILKDTDLYNDYCKGLFKALTMDEYLAAIGAILPVLPKKIW